MHVSLLKAIRFGVWSGPWRRACPPAKYTPSLCHLALQSQQFAISLAVSLFSHQAVHSHHSSLTCNASGLLQRLMPGVPSGLIVAAYTSIKTMRLLPVFMPHASVYKNAQMTLRD